MNPPGVGSVEADDIIRTVSQVMAGANAAAKGVWETKEEVGAPSPAPVAALPTVLLVKRPS